MHKQSKWIEFSCRRCDRVFAVHRDWDNKPEECNVCRLKDSDIADGVDTLLNTNLVPISNELKEQLQKISDAASQDSKERSILLFRHCLCKNLNLDPDELYISKKLLDNDYYYFHPDVAAQELCELNPGSFEGISDSRLCNLVRACYVNTRSKKARDILLKDSLADLISGNSGLCKALFKALKIQRKLKNLEPYYKNRNAGRSGLIVDGKRRLS